MAITDVPDDATGLLTWLQGWVVAMCDGDWEHDAGIRLETLDNPGWRLTIALSGTGHDEKPLDRVKVERDEHDWVHAWVEDGVFEAACGPTNLTEVLFIFREWVSV